MSQTLIADKELIQGSYKTALATWRETLKYTIPLFLVPLVLTFIATPLLVMAAFSGSMASIGLISLVCILAVIVLMSWPTVKLMRFFLEKDLGHAVPSADKEVNMALILSYLWVTLLVAVIAGLGYIVFIIPGIWLIGLLVFSQYCLLEDGIKGTNALRASVKLVKGRWWKVFGKLFIVGLVAAIVMFVVSFVIGLITGIITGIFGTGLIGATLVLIISLGSQVVLSVLVTLYSLAASVKLFHALKHTPVEAPKPIAAS